MRGKSFNFKIEFVSEYAIKKMLCFLNYRRKSNAMKFLFLLLNLTEYADEAFLLSL